MKREGKELTIRRGKQNGTYTKIVGAAPCAIPDCTGWATTDDLCNNHFKRRRQYGISKERLIELLETKVCENMSCANSTDLFIDHNHITGKVRGRICRSCNTALGFTNDDPVVLAGLIEYLKDNNE
jgi:hypothetical protein